MPVGPEPMSDKDKYARDEAYWANQKTVCAELEPVSSSIEKVKAYIKSAEASDPMLNPCNPIYDGGNKKGGGCSVM